MTGKQKPVFDFRWGVAWMDKSRQGGADVPGFVLRNYNQLGVTLQEMMLIIHLSAYHFNSEQGEAKPSLKTISDMMGYRKDDSVRSLLAKLEEKKLVSVERNPGKCSVYDFSPFAKQCYELDTSGAKSLCEEVPHPNGVPHADGEVVPHPNGDEDQEEKINNKNIAQTPSGAARAPASHSQPTHTTPAPIEVPEPDTTPPQPIGPGVVESQPPRKRKQRAPADRVPAALMNPMKDAIAAAFGWDWDAMTDDETGLIQKAARQLCRAKATPDEVPRVYAYCAQNFEQFGPGALTTNLSKARAKFKPQPMKPVIRLPKNPSRDCKECGGNGQTTDLNTGKTIPCRTCLAAEEAADGEAA